MKYENNFSEYSYPQFIKTIEPIKEIGKIWKQRLMVSILTSTSGILYFDIRRWKEDSPTHKGLFFSTNNVRALRECIAEYEERIAEIAKARNGGKGLTNDNQGIS